jgi:hypothetical protein
MDAPPPRGCAAAVEAAHMLTAAEIAAALGGTTRNGRGWLARCCCHEDKQP